MKKSLVIFIVIVTMSFSATVFAGPANKVAFQREAQTGSVTVGTSDYNFNINAYGRNWKLNGYDQNADPLKVFTSIKENSMSFLYDTKVLNRLITDGEVVVTYNKETVAKIAKIIMESLDNISQPIGYQWNNGVGSTTVIADVKNKIDKVAEKVSAVETDIATNDSFINALWIENHGFSKITVHVHINKADKSIKILDLDGKIIGAYFVIKDGDMSAMQTKRVTKLTTLAWNAKYGEFGILHCADVYAGKPIKTSAMEDVREVDLFVTHKHLTKTGVKKILASVAFGFTTNEINEMLR